MKLLFTILLVITSYIAFGQSPVSDTTIFVDGDSMVIYRGETLKHPEIKNGPLVNYVNKSLTKDMIKYIDKGNHGIFYFKLVIDSLGKVRQVTLLKGEMDYLSDEFIKIFISSTWSPAISKDSIPVNTMLAIPIRF